VPVQTRDLAASALRFAATVAPTSRISVELSARTRRGGGSVSSAYFAPPGPGSALKKPANPIKAAFVEMRDRRCRIGAATHHFQKVATQNLPCASGLGDDDAIARAFRRGSNAGQSGAEPPVRHGVPRVSAVDPEHPARGRYDGIGANAYGSWRRFLLRCALLRPAVYALPHLGFPPRQAVVNYAPPSHGSGPRLRVECGREHPRSSITLQGEASQPADGS
jgi:hypothetical protein